MAFFTGKGDKGKSYICGGTHAKTCVEIVALGDLDELNSLLGVVRNMAVPAATKKLLVEVQNDLFTIQANVYRALVPKVGSVPALAAEKVRDMERVIAAIEKRVPPVRSFIIPGTTPASAWLDYARAVARRAERGVLTVARKKKLASPIFVYLNRLSSLLYALARDASARAKKREQGPSYQ